MYNNYGPEYKNFEKNTEVSENSLILVKTWCKEQAFVKTLNPYVNVITSKLGASVSLITIT